MARSYPRNPRRSWRSVPPVSPEQFAADIEWLRTIDPFTGEPRPAEVLDIVIDPDEGTLSDGYGTVRFDG